jgi:hypothetical protein
MGIMILSFSFCFIVPFKFYRFNSVYSSITWPHGDYVVMLFINFK